MECAGNALGLEALLRPGAHTSEERCWPKKALRAESTALLLLVDDLLKKGSGAPQLPPQLNVLSQVQPAGGPVETC